MALGVELIFNALKTRFDAQTTTLKPQGRILSMDPEGTRPWTECEFFNHRTEDSFDDDIEFFSVRFTLHGDSPRIRQSTLWLDHVTDFFDDFFTLPTTAWTCGGIQRLDADDGPVKEDGVWDASAEWELMLTRNTPKPAVRGV